VSAKTEQAAQQPTNEAAALLSYYHNDGCKLVRLSRQTKQNVDKDWQNRDVSLSEIVAWYERGGNIGMQLGAVSDWRGAADCDCPEAVALAPRFLPPTLRLGKGSGVPDVYLYRSPELGFAKFTGLGGETLIDLKASNNGAGHQIAVPPSVHPDKGAYRWAGGYNPASIAEVSADALRAAVGRLAVATLIARNMPPKGGIHDFELALAGFLLRPGRLEREEARELMLAAWRVAGVNHQEAERGVENAVSSTAQNIAAGRPTAGGRILEELVAGMPAKIAKFLGWERAASLDGAAGGAARDYTRSDLGNAERFLDKYGDKVRWCPARKAWFLYDDTRWAPDERGHVVKLAHETARSIFQDAAHEEDGAKQKEIAKFAVLAQNKTRIDGMLSQAKPYLAVSMDELDRDPWDLNCKNGTLDLRSGDLRAHDPADLVTRLAPVAYDPTARCPRFKKFLKETLVDDGVISFMKRYTGYTLTGITRERLFAILYGFGKNGKTTLVELLQDVVGDYATNTDTETILAKKYQGVGNDIAALKGARFVSAAEVEQGRRLAEAKVKQLTGADTVTARFLFGEPFNFRPAFKLWLSTNNKPIIQGTDDAIWDRIRLVPFTQRFEGPKADTQLPEKLREESPGILAWAVEGCLEWQEHGLGEPASVVAATNQYRSEMDTLAAFFEERCVIRPDAVAQATPLYKEYRMWCDDAGERPEKQKTFGMRLAERGFKRRRETSGVNKGRNIWIGIGLRNDIKPPGGGDDGSPGEPSGDDRSPDESGVGIGNTSGGGCGGERSEPTNQQVPLEYLRVRENVEKRFTSFTSFTADEKTTGGGPQPNSKNSQTHAPPDAPPGVDSDVRKLFDNPPAWLRTQARICREQGAPPRLIEPLAAAVATHLYGDPTRREEIMPAVEAQFHPLGCECEVCI
jgi:putative DNA primase/helicase